MENQYGSFVFMDESKRKEWEEMDPKVKKGVTDHLARSAKRMSQDLALEMLCHHVMDLEKRIAILEGK